MSQKLLKIKLYQPFANFRKPFSYGIVDSYPLPPPSTVKGWLHNILGAKNGEYYKMAVSICGKFNSIVYDIQRIIKFDRLRKEDSSAPILKDVSARVLNGIIYVTNLVDVELCIHVNAEQEVLKGISLDIFNSYWGLGRKEDLLRVDEVKFFEPQVVEYREYVKHKLPDIGMYLKTSTAEKLRVDGIRFRLNNRYIKTKDGLRIFTDKKDVVYFENLQHLNPIMSVSDKLLVDDENILIDLIGDDEYESL
ncbi:CRISPR-associated Cas5t family protein [Caldicellulosiruptor bescii]|uniref:CRISPR-associated protein Cas5 family n=2 Tax=Caldicellulosiruptor bescii TaxID=31899 RepID=B9MLS4_CALBD|nr:type I-B CRISPR-associated protein Cas5b [Caldicellulosiruptor bescii]ACM59282.1 CRISPR-associated protein Cas5 family [Caldicellulosiruptor bescii DSM 6725]PBC88261.1 CRISPR-associated Cas5t family protein [Caldicellulosiruptor bescii]PBC92258.1 CRISPR-associated Cas5t family protein [Caldicellulosiruptor bescii]PBD04933.1 CRISPR-associated Cas5t family protein [Caldicellulosiruptor bescii]PBD05437.1 CRISPR-associated Cas5t family protein [Caldicellulosiruptor bescii]